VNEVTADIGGNKGNATYVLSETILSFTILPFALSLLGLCLAIRKKETCLYPAAAILLGFFAESTLQTILLHGEQKYLTRLFPLLVIFVAYAVDWLLKKARLEGPVKNVAALAIVALLVYSSYALVHRGLGEGQVIFGHSDMRVVILPADQALESDLQKGNLDYIILTEVLKLYGTGNFERIIINGKPDAYAEYIRIIEGKEVYQLNETNGRHLEQADIIVIVSIKSKLDIPGTQEYSMIATEKEGAQYVTYPLYAYVITPEVLTKYNLVFQPEKPA
jgi:hypothetical protein